MNWIHRIRTKLAFSFIIVTIIPALLVGYYSAQVSSEVLLEKEYSTQSDKLDRLKNQIENFLSSANSDVLFLSQSDPVGKLLQAREEDKSGEELAPYIEAVKNEFFAFSSQRKIYYQVRYLDETGQEVVRVDHDGTKAKVIPKNRLQNKGKRYYFKDAVDLRKHQVFISPLDLNRERGKVEVPHKPVIRYATPVKFSDGSNAGVVLTNADAKQFLTTIKGNMLVDGTGYFLAHPVPSKEWGGPTDLNTRHTFIKEFPQAGYVTGAFSGTVQTQDLALTFKEINIPGAAATRTWKLITTKKLTELLAGITEFRKTFFLILFGSVVVAILIALFFDQKISKPIEELTDEANNVSMGKLDNPVFSMDKGEIGRLAEAFERMRVSMVMALGRSKKDIEE